MISFMSSSSSRTSTSPRFIIVFVLGLVFGGSMMSIWDSLTTTQADITTAKQQQEEYLSSLPTTVRQVIKQDDDEHNKDNNDDEALLSQKRQKEELEEEIQQQRESIQRIEQEIQRKEQEIQRKVQEHEQERMKLEKEKKEIEEQQRQQQQKVAAETTTPEELASSTKTKTNLTLGQQIVELAFDWAYRDMLEYCPDRGYDYFISTQTSFPGKFEYFRQCLESTYYKKLIHNTTLQSKYPWWLLTLIRDSADKKTGLLGGWHQLYLSPEIEMCVYEKGGTKNWKASTFKLRQIAEEKKKKKKEQQQQQQQQNQTSQQPQNQFFIIKPTKHPDQFIFIRDPLDRFLSGFLDKCVSPHYYGEPHCEPMGVFAEERLEYERNRDKLVSNVEQHRFRANALSTNFSTVVNDFRKVGLSKTKQKLFEAYVDAFPLKWNVHFIPLSFQCGGLYNTLKYYSFRGSMGPDFYNEIDKLTTKYPSIRDVVDEKFKFTEQLKKQQQRQNTTTTTQQQQQGNNNNNANNVGVETKAASKVLDYYTPSTVRKVLEYFSMDYKMLQIPIPKWAEDMLLLEEEQHDQVLMKIKNSQ